MELGEWMVVITIAGLIGEIYYLYVGFTQGWSSRGFFTVLLFAIMVWSNYRISLKV